MSPIEKAKGLPSFKESLKARFSDPPAPPPQAPLPEKPDVHMQRPASGFGSGMFQPSSLSRSETERPKLGSVNSSPVKPVSNGMVDSLASAAQIANLIESLAKTKQEVEVQSARLREVEDQLMQERVLREDAEERAKRLEKERKSHEAPRIQVPESPVKAVESATPIDEEQQEDEKVDNSSSDKKLQERLDLLLAEFNEVKASAERYKHDKEQAEKERDGRAVESAGEGASREGEETGGEARSSTIQVCLHR
jgi:chromosome segregation ATPase